MHGIGDEQVSVVWNVDTCFGVAAVLSEDSGEAAEIVPSWECRKARFDAARLLRSAESGSTASQFEPLVRCLLRRSLASRRRYSFTGEGMVFG
jgi:hypothetical protein